MLIDTINSRIEYLRRMIDHKVKKVAEAPEGFLKIRNVKGRPRFYQCTNNGTKIEKYIGSSDLPLITALAQKSYDLDLISRATRELTVLEKAAKVYPAPLEYLYDELDDTRQSLVTPVVKPSSQLLQEWYDRPFTPKQIGDGIPVILTAKGERVRSKSEKIIADFYYHNNILYKYECPLELKSTLKGYSHRIHPDFTLFSTRRRVEIYHEHLGMMDKPSYYLSRMALLKNYEDNGYLIGDRLLITYETGEFVLDISNLEAKLGKLM